MNKFFSSYKKLGFLERVGLWGSIASIVGFVFLFIPNDGISENPMQKQDGTANQQAGRDIINYHNEAQKPSSSSLEITNVRYKGSQMDFLLRNLGDVDLIIHEIKLTNTLPKPKPGSCPPATPGAGGILMPSAKYEVDADSYKVDANSINEGESKAINVSHVIPAHSADRILIAINLYCGSKFKIEFKYNKDQIASFTESNER